MSGDVQRGSSPTTRTQREKAAITFGGGKEATVRRDYRKGGRRLLRAGERVRYFDMASGTDGGLVRVYRTGAERATLMPARLLKAAKDEAPSVGPRDVVKRLRVEYPEAEFELSNEVGLDATIEVIAEQPEPIYARARGG